MDPETVAEVRGPLSGLLFVAGEASGDRLAAEILLAHDGPAFGLGGDASRAAGGEVRIDLGPLTGAGLVDAARRLPRIVAAYRELRRLVRERRPKTALLVDYVEANALFGRWLRARGVRVVWCVAPQIWAWRPGRIARLARSMDRLAALFPFEVAAWRAAGVDAHWVGHPALETRWASRAAARAEVAIPDHGPALALLPGSRPREIARNLPGMLAAADRLALPTRVLVAGSLDLEARAHVARLAGAARVVPIAPAAGLAPVLRAFDVAVAAAGTATLECALAGVPPVVVARVDRLAAAAFGRLIRTPHLALPNVLLGERAYPELWQDEATPSAIVTAVRALLAAARRDGESLRRVIDPSDGRRFGRRVADLLTP